ncbi:phage virion morphogenesis protein [Candidatus Regiella insecticola]|uniref:Phage virion morphogenesis protein n=1 Tax=Candidatus Regiella insecticola TaxID=138073 RepID=A0A6L2ZP27_9ENTR|nr:phage virion morphogenesis protein [Candidatus Regiella insecticola]GFN45948.1 phage virion morphogenesis protein [Candidatus Regiella insecticola]
MTTLTPADPLRQALAHLLKQLSPARRKAFTRQIAKQLRQKQKQRIQAQQAPDGTPFAPRKQKRRDKHGRIKRKMFTQLRTARFLKHNSSAEEATLSFARPVTPVARVHHYGLRDKVARNGVTVRYESRPLLGLTDKDIERITDLALMHLVG